jgi:hypothetical protein
MGPQVCDGLLSIAYMQRIVAARQTDSDSVTFPGAIESLTCGTTDMWGPHVSDSMAPRMAPGNVTESQSATNPLLFSNRHESLLLLRILHARTVPANPQNPSGARTVRRPPGGLRRRRVTTAPPASLESNIAVLGARRRRRPLESVAPSPVLE